MSRTLSAAAVAQLTRQHSSESYLPLVTISDPAITTLRVVYNTVNIVSRGNTFEACGFEFTFPADISQERRPARIRFPNVDRMLIPQIRTLASPLKMVVELITASAPNTVEIGPLEFRMSVVDWDDEWINATLAFKTGVGSQYPNKRFDPALFPQLHGVLNAA